MNSTKGQKLTVGAEQWFQNGIDAMGRRNWDYGLECLEQAVALQPDELEYRKQKHRCCRRKFGKPGDVSRMAAVKLATIRSRIMTAQLTKDWLTIDRLAEDGISLNPWDAQMFAHIANAAADAGRFEIARYAWSTAIKIDKDNASYYRAFGGLLQANGEFELAKSCFQRIQSIDPTGRIAHELICAVDVASVLNVGGYSSARNARDVEVGREPRPLVAAEAPVPPAESPTPHQVDQKLVAFVTLAEQHIQNGELSSAVEAYGRAIAIAPHNASLNKRMEDVEIAIMRQDAIGAQDDAKRHPDCERRRAKATQRMTQLTSRELEILSLRVKNNPEDLLFAFQLADLYRRAAQVQKAIPLFQKAMLNTQLKPEAMIGLGECWARAGEPNKGLQQLMAALKIIHADEKPNAFKLAHYWLGRLHESRKHLEQAEAHYSEILKVDFRFRDVTVRLDALRVR